MWSDEIVRVCRGLEWTSTALSGPHVAGLLALFVATWQFGRAAGLSTWASSRC
jgi:hypothetical protein